MNSLNEAWIKVLSQVYGPLNGCIAHVAQQYGPHTPAPQSQLPELPRAFAARPDRHYPVRLTVEQLPD